MNFSTLSIIAAIAIPIIAAFIPLVYKELKQRRGNRVIVNLLSITPKLTIPEDLRRNLGIYYKGNNVENVVSHVLKIRNNGTEIIEPFELTIIVIPEDESQKIEFIESQVNDYSLVAESADYVFDSRKHAFVQVWRKYLNPWKRYREDVLDLSVISNTSLFFSVFGGDRDWVLDQRSREPRNINLLVRAYKYDKFIWPFSMIGLACFYAYAFRLFASVTFLYIGIVGLSLVVLYGVYQTTLTTLDFTSMLRELRSRNRRARQINDDPQVQREIEILAKRVEFMKRNEKRPSA